MSGRSGPSGYQQASLALDQHGVPRENGEGRKLSLTERINLLGRKVPELMGVKEAAACLGVATGNFDGVRGLPDPVAVLDRDGARGQARRIFLAEEIKALARERAAARKARAAR